MKRKNGTTQGYQYQAVSVETHNGGTWKVDVRSTQRHWSGWVTVGYLPAGKFKADLLPQLVEDAKSSGLIAGPWTAADDRALRNEAKQVFAGFDVRCVRS